MKDLNQTASPEMSRRGFISVLGGGALALAAGCGGGNGGSGTTGSITPGSKSAALSAIGNYYNTLPRQSMDVDNVSMLTFIKARPELHSVVLTGEGTIAGLFSDGVGFVFVNNLDDHDSDTRSAKPVAIISGSGRNRDANQVAGGKAVLLNGLGVLLNGNPSGLANQFINEIRGNAHLGVVSKILTNTGGYRIKKDYASLSNLRGVTQTDILYFLGHGGLGIDAKTNSQIYVINTSDSIDDTAADSALNDDLASGRIGYMIFTGTVLENGVKQRRWKKAYYITPGFVQTHMSFNKYSMVFINGCAGAGPATGAAPAPGFQAAFFAAQASSYISWDDKVNAGDVRDSAEFLFDRMAGAGISNVTGVQTTPPTRPFDYSAVLAEMSNTKRSDQSFNLNQSIDSDPVKPGDPARKAANLVIIPNSADQDTFGQLTPTISGLNVNMNDNQLIIIGEFGSVPGSVTMAGQALSVVNWQPSFITCGLPEHDAPNASGDVVVIVNDHKSNAARLSMWVITLKMESDYAYHGTVGNETLSGSSKYNCEMQLWLRGDASGERGMPGSPTGSNYYIGTFGLLHTYNTKDAKLSSFTASGTAIHQLNFQNNMEQIQETFSTVGSAPVPFDGSDSRVAGLDVSGKIDPVAGTFKFHIVCPLSGTVKSTMSDNIVNPVGMATLEFMDSINMSLDGNYGITSGASDTYTLEGNDYTYTRNITWDNTPAVNPPDGTVTRLGRKG